VIGAVVIEFEALEALDVPTELVAVMVKVYAVLAVSPVTEMVPDPACDIVPDPPTGLEVTEYDVIVAPPLLAGAVKETVAVV
jgi:hypothetical protein